MPLATAKKREVIGKYKAHATDTGSSAVQVALITERINSLAGHFKSNVKDHASRLGLLKLVNQRKKFLKYILRHEPKKYQELVDKLNLRK